MDTAASTAEAVAALRDSGARFGLLFGSRARGTARDDSDIDIAAWWPADPPASFDVLVPPEVDLLVLNSAALELAGRVAVEGTVPSTTTQPPGFVGWRPPARSTSTSCRG